jgi:hypothetical protein
MARSPAQIFSNAATVIKSGGGEKPQIIMTFPDIDTAHEASALIVDFMKTPTPTLGRAAEPDTMGEVERLTRERNEARADAERAEAERDELRDAPWPKWVTDCLTIIRKHSGYDGYDDAVQGVDLPAELEETLDEVVTRAETAEAQLATLRAALTKIVAVADKDSLVDTERLSDIRSVTRSALLSTSGAD